MTAGLPGQLVNLTFTEGIKGILGDEKDVLTK